MLFVDRHQRTRDAHAQSVGLAGEATARSSHSDVEVPFRLNELDGLLYPDPETGPWEVFVKGAPVD
jgi:hypothetical protein